MSTDHAWLPLKIERTDIDEFAWFADTGTSTHKLMIGGKHRKPDDPERMAYIVRAANCHADLLAACEAALDYHRPITPGFDMRVSVVFIEDMLRAAIAKAEGR